MMAEPIEYLFCINTGRSGSHYLGSILNHISGCLSLHEPDPIGNGAVMRRYLSGQDEPMRQFTKKKVQSIQHLKKDSPVYAETNHCFIKGFGWFIPEYLPQEKVGVIILKREQSKIANSMLRVGCSPLVSGGRDWIGTPQMQSPLVTPPQRMGACHATYQVARLIKFPFRALNVLVDRLFAKRLGYPGWLTRYELECLEWYVQETYARAELFKRTFPAIRYYEVSIDDLNSLEAIERMVQHFGLEGKASLKEVVGKPTNLKTA